jgi:hypothetical protein
MGIASAPLRASPKCAGPRNDAGADGIAHAVLAGFHYPPHPSLTLLQNLIFSKVPGIVLCRARQGLMPAIAKCNQCCYLYSTFSCREIRFSKIRHKGGRWTIRPAFSRRGRCVRKHWQNVSDKVQPWINKKSIWVLVLRTWRMC